MPPDRGLMAVRPWARCNAGTRRVGGGELERAGAAGASEAAKAAGNAGRRSMGGMVGVSAPRARDLLWYVHAPEVHSPREGTIARLKRGARALWASDCAIMPTFHRRVHFAARAGVPPRRRYGPSGAAPGGPQRPVEA